jgi:hypothetical protein
MVKQKEVGLRKKERKIIKLIILPYPVFLTWRVKSWNQGILWSFIPVLKKRQKGVTFAVRSRNSSQVANQHPDCNKRILSSRT